MNALEKLCGGTNFTKLTAYIRKFFAFRQQKGWNMARYLTEFNQLFREGEAEFNIKPDPQFVAGAMTVLQNIIPPEQVANITSAVDWKSAGVKEKVEQQMRA